MSTSETKTKTMSKQPERDAPAFDFYAERWLAGVAHMTDAEQISYLRLLCHQWTMDGLPDDEIVLKRMAGRGLSATVLMKFPVDGEGKRRNSRLEVVRASQRERIRKSQSKIARMNESKREKLHARQPAESGGETPLAECLVEPLVEALQEKQKGASGGVLSASSPLTTHHPPHVLNISSSSSSSGGQSEGTRTVEGGRASGARACTCEVAEALVFAEGYSKGNALGLMITPEQVDAWHDDRSKVGWVTVKRGLEFPVVDWKADLRGFARNWQFHERTQAQAQTPAQSPGGNRQGAAMAKPRAQTDTVWGLQQQIKATEDSMSAVMGIYSYKSLSAQRRVKYDELRTHLRGLKDRMTGIGV